MGGDEESAAAPGILTYIPSLKCKQREVGHCMRLMLSRKCPWCLHISPQSNKAIFLLAKELTTVGASAASRMPSASNINENDLSWDWSQSHSYNHRMGMLPEMSTGFVAVAAALQLCKSVAIYGFSLTSNNPSHLDKNYCVGGPTYAHYFNVGLKNFVLENPQGFDCRRNTAFSHADLGRFVVIRDDEVNVDGIVRIVRWRWGMSTGQWAEARHRDCAGRIQSVDEKPRGAVQLENGDMFENPQGNASLEGGFTHPFEVEHRALAVLHALGLLTVNM